MSPLTDPEFTLPSIKRMVPHVLTRSWENVSTVLSSSQRNMLSGLNTDKHGIECLLKMWLIEEAKLAQGIFCNATWDNHYCWPYTPAGTTTSRKCSEAFEESEPIYASHITGTAFRHCLPNGTWMQGNWTNYTECANSYDEYVEQTEKENELKTQVRLIVFIGSILSLVCLVGAIAVFCSFRSIWCDRVTIHVHLMAALTLRYVLLYIITEAFIFDRNPNYRSVDWVCKTVLVIYLYATVASVNWMLIQGIYLNRILTANVFDKEAPLKSYFIFGWVLPAPLLGIYTTIMEIYHPVHCWKGYSYISEAWIILGPIIAALMVEIHFRDVNLLLLVNILRILMTKVHHPCASSDFVLFKRTAKATLVLSPILGINNLLFVYNPGGTLHRYYVLLNTTFGSTQGIFVAVLYCYLSSDVCNAVRRCYRRYLAKQQAAHSRRAQSNSTSTGLIVERPVHLYKNSKQSSSHPNLYSLRERPLSPAFTIQLPNKYNDRSQAPTSMHTLSPFSQDYGDGSLYACNPFLSRSQNCAESWGNARRGSRSEQQLESSQVIVPLRDLI